MHSNSSENAPLSLGNTYVHETCDLGEGHLEVIVLQSDTDQAWLPHYREHTAETTQCHIIRDVSSVICVTGLVSFLSVPHSCVSFYYFILVVVSSVTSVT